MVAGCGSQPTPPNSSGPTEPVTRPTISGGDASLGGPATSSGDDASGGATDADEEEVTASDAASDSADAVGAGDADDAGGLPPFVATGSPITGPDGSWTWTEFPDTSCRDGSMAGIAVNFEAASSKVLIFIQGGGACFDSVTCAINPANTTGGQTPQAAGIFDRTNTQNPAADWNFVYVPYCTGDIGAGANPNGMVSGVTGTQKFVGYLNLQSFLNRIVPTFPHATQVLLTGVSAGGFGAAVNAPLVQRAFPALKIALIDDSGPPMSSQYLPSCLQDEWRTTWGLDGSILKECGSACPNSSDYALDYALFLGKRFGDRKAGLIESDTDSVISAFYGYGNDNCTGSILTPVAGATFTAGLNDFRSQIVPVDPNFGTYYPDSSQHTWLGGASLYTETQGGTTLISWVTGIVNDTAATQVGP